VTKTVSIARFADGRAGDAIRAAQEAPVLGSQESLPAAWIVSAERLADVAAARGVESAETYQRALALIAVEQYEYGRLTLVQAARLAGLLLDDFIDLCGRLRVPVLWEPADGLDEEIEAAEAIAGPAR